MSILQRLFRSEAPVDVTDRNETDDVLDELAAEAKQRERAQAERVARERRETIAYRARVTAEANERRGRMHESLDELGDLVPRLLLACSHFTTIAREVQEKGLGFDGGGLLEDHFGIPPDFGVRLIAALHEIAPRTEWDFSATGVLGTGVKAERPKIKAPQPIRMPRFAGDMAAPFGFSGVWNLITGRPL